LDIFEVSATGVHRAFMIRSQTGPDRPRGDDQVRIQIVVKNSNKETKETTWARHLRDDLYEIKDPLHLIVGLHLHDIVRAKSVSGESVPSVIEVVKRSGYKTLHILFAHDVSDEQQTRILVRLREFGAEEEAPFDRFCTIVLPPEANYETVIAFLNSEKQRGAIIYEPDVSLSTLLRSRFTSSGY